MLLAGMGIKGISVIGDRFNDIGKDHGMSDRRRFVLGQDLAEPGPVQNIAPLERMISHAIK